MDIEKEKELARYNHELELERISFEKTIDYSMQAMKAMLLINGASVLATPAFIGLFDLTRIHMVLIQFTMKSFALGVFTAALSMCLSYLSQAKSTIGNKKGFKFFNSFALASAATSLIAFFSGVYFFTYAI